MKCHRRHLLTLASWACLAPVTRAEPVPWPGRPLRLVAGGAGGVTDIRARWLAPRLAQALGHEVVVDNSPAAGGNLAAAEVARSAPDGTTVLVLHQGIAAVNPHLYARPGYDPLKDLQPVTRFGHGPLLLSVPAASPVRSVAELLTLARAQPALTHYGSPGHGTPPHLAGELLCRMADIRATHVPYRGGGALMAALLGGQLTWCMEGLTAQLPHVRGGALRALAVTGTRPAPGLPTVPTVAEAGVPGYEYEGWTGFAVAAATPRAIVERLHEEIARIAATAEAREWFAAAGAEVGTLSPAQTEQFVRSEYARWGKFIRETGLRAE